MAPACLKNGKRLQRPTTTTNQVCQVCKLQLSSFFINSSNIISFEFWPILHAVTPAHAFFLHVVAARLPELCVSLPLLLLLAVFGFVMPAESPGGRFACLQIPSGNERQQYAMLQLMDRDVQLIEITFYFWKKYFKVKYSCRYSASEFLKKKRTFQFKDPPLQFIYRHNLTTANFQLKKLWHESEISYTF